MRKRLFTLLLMLCPLLIAGMASAVTYSVAGSSAALFGASWDPTNTSTDMTSTDGVNYTFTKEGVTLSKGTIEYKVVVDHSWNTCYGKDGGNANATYTLSEDGVYDVVVSFNAETHVPSMEATKKGSATVDHTWSVIGGIFGTNWNQDWAMTETSSGVFTCTVEDQEISAGTYEYKVRADNAWDLSYGDPNGNNGNASFTIDKDGKYNVTFTFTLATGAVEATPTLIEETVIDAIYTAVGTPAAIFGAAWDPSLVANEMVKGTDGVTYTFTKEGVVLEAEDIQFKVIKGHSWGGEEYGDNGNNVVYNVTEAGTYDVTITFNSETGATPVITVTKQGGDEPIDKTIESVFLKGDFDNWGDGLYLEHSAAAANQFVGTLDLTNVTGDVKIKLLAYDNDNMEYWKGYAGITTLISDGSWLSDANDNDNILLSNSTTGYKTYAVTATWEGIDPETGWTLTIAGLDQRESTPVDGQELVNGDHKVVIKGVHYLNLTENNYVLTIKSEETMTGLGGSFWSINGVDGNDMRNVTVVEEEGKKLVLTVTSNQDPEIYTPLYVMMPGEVIFTGNGRGNSPVIEWQEEGEVTPVGEYKVKFVNMAGWETVKAHAWNNDGAITEWPGIEGTAVDNTTAFGNSYPTFEFTFTSEPTNVQFNKGNNTKELNFTYVEGALYSYDGLADKSIFLFTDDANQFKPAQNFDVAGAKASYARKFTPGNVCTVVLPFAIGADVAKDAGKFYRINSIADGYIRGTEETPAPYVPYIFVPATEYPFTNIGIGQLPAVQNSSITTGEGYTLQFVTETTELASDASFDYYGFQGGKFVKAAYATVNPFRSYIMVAKSANAPATLIWTDDEATGISSLKADIQNGKANVYDLQGRRVLNPVRGLYIVNGKKVIVK